MRIRTFNLIETYANKHYKQLFELGTGLVLIFSNLVRMIKNYFRIALRTMSKNKVLSLINISGLAIGLAVCSLIALFVQDELSFDQFHSNKNRIYRVMKTQYNPDGTIKESSPDGEIPLGPVIIDEFPQIEAMSRFDFFQANVVYGTQKFKEEILEVDPGIFEMFSINFLRGNPATALKDNYSLVISESIAEKYFGKSNPLDEEIRIFLGDELKTFRVSGVVEDIPHNSTVRFDMCIPFTNLKQRFPWAGEYWNSFRLSGFPTFVMLREGQSIDEVSLQKFFNKHHPDDLEAFIEDGTIKEGEDPPVNYTLQVLTDIHLNSNVGGGMHESSDPLYSYILLGIAFFILAIACVNYVNLNIARSASRAVEVGIRKAVGAGRRQIIFQFIGESLLISLMAFFIAIFLAELFLGEFNELTQKSIEFMDIFNPLLFLILLGVVLMSGFLSGIYPALFLSNISVQAIMRRKLRVGGNNWLSQGLVSLQFLLAIALLSATLIMSKQLRFMQNKDLGFKGDQIIVMDVSDKSLSALKKQLYANPNILNVQGMSHSIGRGRISSSFEYNGTETNHTNVFGVEPGFIDMMELELISGRDFDKNRASDSMSSIIVNQAFVEKFMADKNPLEESISVPGFDLKNAKIIGVVKNFYFGSVGQSIDPVFFTINNSMTKRVALVKLQKEQIPKGIEEVEKAWNDIFPVRVFEFKFIDENIQRLYENDKKWLRIINYSGITCILIASMGLFGMAAINLVNRTKEIGVRKVLGAGFPEILNLLFRQFYSPILIAFALAVPISYYLTGEWLNNFANRIQPGFDVYFLSALVISIISTLTILYYAIKGTRINPVDALRSE